MYLSRVELAWQSAPNPYEVHRRLWKLFPGQEAESRRDLATERQGFLFRLEEHRPGRPIQVLLQSRSRPREFNGAVVLGCKEFHPQPQTGQHLGFLLTANPIKTITDGEKHDKPEKKSDKCRVPLVREEDQLAWLGRKLSAVAAIDAVTVLQQPPTYFRKGSRAGKLVTVHYEGVLRVSEPEGLIPLLENGVGPAKAFGCGLLLVRRL